MQALRTAATGMAAQQLNVEVISNNIAIDGRGFFSVLLPTGETAYTRAGNFSINDQGQIVTADGYLVQPTIAVPQNATSVTISKSGQVEAAVPGSTAPQVVGQLTLSTFVNE